MELSQAYATRIKQLMKENRVNLYKLSKMSGVPHPTISVLLSCKTNVLFVDHKRAELFKLFFP